MSYNDWKAAQTCYKMLYDGGLKGKIKKALTKFTFAHQKYWIIDGQEVHLSTGGRYCSMTWYEVPQRSVRMISC